MQDRCHAVRDQTGYFQIDLLSATTTSAVYTAAAQTADWGAPLGPGDNLTIRIFQLSALVGRGATKTVTLSF